MERAEIQTVLELAKQMFMEDAPKAHAAAVARPEPCEPKCGGSNSHTNNGCSVPLLAVYFVFTDCVVINNGACPEWEFCRTID